MSEPLVIASRDVADTVAVGAAVGRLCRAGDVIGVNGELGAGKTQFVRGLAQGLGLDPRRVSSPTFVVAQEYEPAPAPGMGAGSVTLVHIDAYRLTSGDELAALGWAGEGGDLPEDAVLAIEWSDRVADVLPPDRLEVWMEHTEGGRRLTLRPLGAWVARMIQLRPLLAAAQAP